MARIARRLDDRKQAPDLFRRRNLFGLAIAYCDQFLRTVGTERYQDGGVVSTCKTIPLSEGARSSKINRFQVRRLNLEGKGLAFCPKNCIISRIGENAPRFCALSSNRVPRGPNTSGQQGRQVSDNGY
jgi:hypothetical protein